MPILNLDEIGLLTQSFNRMVAWLKRLVSELEARVAQRTAELELSNQKLMREASIQLSVIDDGVGFDPGQHLKDGSQHFGMDMMRERVDSLGGRLELHSAPGQGTRLNVFIPRPGVADLPVDSKGLLGYRVLLVDDSPIRLDGLQKLLSTSGLAVLGLARDGLQAQEMARKLIPDMLLMSIGLPKMDVIQTVRDIKTELPGITIVMLFSSEEQETRFAALKNGASGCLSLGSEIEEFMAVLERLANGELLISPEMAARLLAEFADGAAEIDAEDNDDIPASFARGRINLLQLRIIQLLASGLTNNQVAESLQLSTPAVKQHLQQILACLHQKTRAELPQQPNTSK